MNNDKVSDVEVSLGPRRVFVGDEFMGTVEDMSLEVGEATKEGIEKLQSAPEIRLVKISGRGKN